MKYIPFLVATVLAAFFTSCNQNPKNEDEKSELTFSLDSAVVDAKGEIIDIKYGLNTYDLDQSQNFMYKFNTNNRHGLEVIDMEKMELVEFIPFEVEGPNGTSSRVNSLNYTSADEIALTTSQSILIFNKKGQLQHKYPIDNHDFEGDTIPKDYRMESSGLYIPETNTSINLVAEGSYARGFTVLNLLDNTQKTHWIDGLKKLDDYHLSLTMDGKMITIPYNSYTDYQDGKYILSNDMTNALHYYDLQLDSIVHKEFASQLSPNTNEVYGKKNTDSREELVKAMSTRNKSIRFKDIVYDKQDDQYYRFSAYSTSPEKEEDNWKIILTIFDKDLNQIYETDQLPLDDVPDSYFVKDGKIYIYKNMEDEMGFLILSLSE